MTTRIVGHEAFFDNMGISGLTHPVACQVRFTGSECPIAKAITAGRTYGYEGKGMYYATLDDDGDVQLWYREGPQHIHEEIEALQAAMSVEFNDLLDAWLEEAGKYRGFSGIVEWMRRRGAVL